MYWDDKYGTQGVSSEVCSMNLCKTDFLFAPYSKYNVNYHVGCCFNEGDGEQRFSKSHFKFVSIG